MSSHSLSLFEAKIYAKRLSKYLSGIGVAVKHAQALEVVAGMLGFRDFNTLHATLSPTPSNHRFEATQGGVAPASEPTEQEELSAFLRQVFQENHEIRAGKNPRAVYLATVSESEVDRLSDRVVGAVHALGRRAGVIDAAGRTSASFYAAFFTPRSRSAHALTKALIASLYEDETVWVIKNFSKLKDQRKGWHMRGLIKIIDDAHFEGIHPKGDLVFIDSASFLERHERILGPYVWTWMAMTRLGF